MDHLKSSFKTEFRARRSERPGVGGGGASRRMVLSVLPFRDEAIGEDRQLLALLGPSQGRQSL